MKVEHYFLMALLISKYVSNSRLNPLTNGDTYQMFILWPFTLFIKISIYSKRSKATPKAYHPDGSEKHVVDKNQASSLDATTTLTHDTPSATGGMGSGGGLTGSVS